MIPLSVRVRVRLAAIGVSTLAVATTAFGQQAPSLGPKDGAGFPPLDIGRVAVGAMS